MGISTRGTLGWVYCAALDRSSFDWIFNWACSLCLDTFAWLGCLNAVGCLCRESRAKTCIILYSTHSVGRIILRLCVASDLVCCLRDGNAFAWTHHPCCAGHFDWWFASLPDLGSAGRIKHLGSPRWFDTLGPDPVCGLVV